MKLKQYFSNEIFRASLILIILSNIGSLINLIFQFSMARILNSNDFGALSFLTNLIFVFGVPALAIQTAISKKTTILKMKSQYGKIKGLFLYSFKRLLLVSFFIALLFILLASIFYKRLGMDFNLLLLSSIMIFLSLLYPVVIGIMQGMKKFISIGWNTIIVFGTKLVAALTLVMLGFGVYGALSGIIIGMILAIVFGIMIFWRFNSEQERIDFYNSGELIPFAALLIITLTYSIDILVGKFLFSGEDIGNYSRISLLGKMILFACLSVGTVMFPISSEKHLSGAKSKNIILKSSLLVFLICFAGILFFAFFSKPLVGLLFGQGYIEYSLLLIPLGFAFSFISGINLLVLYGLSIDRFKLKGGLGLIFLFLVQLFCLIRYHESLLVFSYAYAITSGIMFIFTVILSSTWKN